MESGLGDGPQQEALLQVGDVALVPGAGSLTGVLASGDVEPECSGGSSAGVRLRGSASRRPGRYPARC
jgi:hypothetical protein